jgi:hypothetical protein
MKKTKKISLKNSYLFKSSDFVELDSLLSETFNKFTYEAKLIDKSTVTFDSVNELIECDNFKNNLIIEIEIRAAKGEYVYSSVPNCKIKFFRKKGYWDESIECENTYSSEQDNLILEASINRFLDKRVISKKRAVVQPLIHLICSYFICIFTTSYFSDVEKKDGVLSLILISLFLFNWLTAYLFKRLFLGCIFSWGEEEKQFSRRQHLNGMIFWGVIIAFIINIVSGKISTWL